jgi:hypothetical protein
MDKQPAKMINKKTEKKIDKINERVSLIYYGILIYLAVKISLFVILILVALFTESTIDITF